MFTPWVGSRYGKDGSKFPRIKLMLLGVSHYCDGNKSHLAGKFVETGTTDAIHSYALRGSSFFLEKNRTFMNITSLLANRKQSELSDEEISLLWNSILFYNYIPTYIPRHTRPKATDWRDGHIPFRTTLEKFQPHAVLVCGITLWNAVIPAMSDGSITKPWESALETFDRVPFARIAHPSRGSWRAAREEALDPLLRMVAPPPC